MFKNNENSYKNDKIETIIGPSVKVDGDFAGDGDVIVEGIVIGTLKTKNHLRIGHEAKVQAEISAASAFIAGEVNGNIIIEEDLELKSTAKVHGDIICSQISIEKGAAINGKISMNNQKKAPVNNSVMEK